MCFRKLTQGIISAWQSEVSRSHRRESRNAMELILCICSSLNAAERLERGANLPSTPGLIRERGRNRRRLSRSAFLPWTRRRSGRGTDAGRRRQDAALALLRDRINILDANAAQLAAGSAVFAAGDFVLRSAALGSTARDGSLTAALALEAGTVGKHISIVCEKT